MRRAGVGLAVVVLDLVVTSREVITTRSGAPRPKLNLQVFNFGLERQARVSGFRGPQPTTAVSKYY
jgi:hypothetical protein